MTLYSVLAAKCYWDFSVNKFKTLGKTNKINSILCRLHFYLLAYLSLSFVRNVNKQWIYRGSGWVRNKTSNSPAQNLYITDQISFITWREMTDKKSECETDKKSEVTQTRRVRWHRQEEWGDTDKTSEVHRQEEWRWHRQEEWGDTDKKSEVTQTRRVEVTQTRRVRWHRQEEWGDTDKKSEVRQTRRVRWHRQEEWGRVSKWNVKASVFKPVWLLSLTLI